MAAYHYQKALDLDPDNFQALMNYVAMELQLGKKASAEKFYLRAVKINPDNAQVRALANTFTL